MTEGEKILNAYRDGYKEGVNDGYKRGYLNGRLKAFEILKNIIDEKAFEALKMLNNIDEVKLEEIDHE